jgi:hypothetical protein
MNRLQYIQNLKGSTAPKLYKNERNKKWVVKKGSSPEQMKYEAAANAIYEALHIPVPKHYVDKTHSALILEYVDGYLLADSPEYEYAKKDLQNAFVVDALLANWDVIGLNMDNIVVSSSVGPVRIDNGGTFMYRAQGGKKEFGPIVKELDTMRNPLISPSAAKIFGELTNKDIREQIRNIIVPNYEEIIAHSPLKIYRVMEERIIYLIEFMNKEDPDEPNNNYNTIPIDTAIINDIVPISLQNIKSYRLANNAMHPPLLDRTMLNPLQRALVYGYTLDSYDIINKFLYTRIDIYSFTPESYESFSIIGNKIGWGDKLKLLYYYFLNLYNIIYRSPRVVNPFKVFRGVKTWYLNEDPMRFYYMNSFVSTTTSAKIASYFSTNANNHMGYIFIVHPACSYSYVKDISKYPQEEEVILNPYCRYYFAEEYNKNKHFVILPTDLEIPQTYDEFMAWKSKTVGGRYLAGPRNNVMKTLRKPRNNLIKRMNKNKTAKKMSAQNRKSNTEMPSRFTDPIASFPGKAPTTAEMDVIRQMIAAFKSSND